MNEGNNEFDSLIRDTREQLARHVIFSGIEGATNGLICFDNDRNRFLQQSQRSIAWSALEQRDTEKGYGYFGLKDEHLSDKLKSLLTTFPQRELF